MIESFPVSKNERIIERRLKHINKKHERKVL